MLLTTPGDGLEVPGFSEPAWSFGGLCMALSLLLIVQSPLEERQAPGEVP